MWGFNGVRAGERARGGVSEPAPVVQSVGEGRGFLWFLVGKSQVSLTLGVHQKTKPVRVVIPGMVVRWRMKYIR